MKEHSMIGAILRTIQEKWWLIGIGVLLGLLARAMFGPEPINTEWSFKTELPTVRPEQPEEIDLPLTLRFNENPEGK